MGGVIQQEVKLIKLYLLWTALYFLFLLPEWIQTGYFSVGAFVGFCKSTLLSGSYFHLWYVLGMIYATPIYFLAIRYLNQRLWRPLAVLLWGLYAIHYGYSWLIPNSVDRILSLSQSGFQVTEAQFVLLPMMLIGAHISKQAHKKECLPLLLKLVAAFIALVLEGAYLQCHGLTEVTRIFMILPVVYYLFSFLLSIDIHTDKAKYYGALSLIIYCVHPMFCKYVNGFSGSTIMDFIVVCLLSIMTSCAWLYVKHTMRQRIVYG